MSSLDPILKSLKQDMLCAHPDQQELTELLFAEIGEMLREDFSAISQANKRLKLVLCCAASVLETLQQHNIRKKYATDILSVFLDKNVTACLYRVIGPRADICVSAISSAKYELHASQWSDSTSLHWQRAINRVTKF